MDIVSYNTTDDLYSRVLLEHPLTIWVGGFLYVILYFILF